MQSIEGNETWCYGSTEEPEQETEALSHGEMRANSNNGLLAAKAIGRQLMFSVKTQQGAIFSKMSWEKD